jgi:hypothetical protein
MTERPPMRHDMTAGMRACRDACNACRDACLLTLAHSIESGGALADAEHLETVLDCATICDAAASFLTRGSSRHAEVCRACASICRVCEESCRRIGAGTTLRACADACRDCAEACGRMGA